MLRDLVPTTVRELETDAYMTYRDIRENFPHLLPELHLAAVGSINWQRIFTLIETYGPVILQIIMALANGNNPPMPAQPEPKNEDLPKGLGRKVSNVTIFIIALTLTTFATAQEQPTLGANELWSGGQVHRAGGLKPLPARIKAQLDAGQKKQITPPQKTTPIPPIDLRKTASPVEDQDGENSCCPHAACHAYRTAAITAGKPDPRSAVADLYQRINGGRDDGADLDNAQDELTQNGVCCLDFAPELGYRDAEEKPGYLQDRATHRELSSTYCGSDAAILAAITNSKPVLIGIDVRRNFSPDESSWISPPRGPGLGGHALTIVGVRPHGVSWDYLIQNSWGQRWGDGGYAWIDHRWADAEDYGAFAVDETVTKSDCTTGICRATTTTTTTTNKNTSLVPMRHPFHRRIPTGPIIRWVRKWRSR